MDGGDVEQKIATDSPDLDALFLNRLSERIPIATDLADRNPGLTLLHY